MDLRLCSDTGWVDDLPIEGEDTADASYLDRHNRLRNESRAARGDKPETTTERFMCTGSAHFLGQHFRCSSPAHALHLGAVGYMPPPNTVVVNGETYTKAVENPDAKP